MLYVTLTRARRLLVVPDGSKLYDGRMPNFLGLARWDKLDPSAILDPPPAPPAAPEAGLSAEAEDPGPPYFEENKRRLSRAAAISQQIPRRILPSGLVHNQSAPAPGRRADVRALDSHGQSLDGEDDRLLASEGIGRLDTGADEPLAGIGGIDYGNWWHAVLERYPWRAADERARDEYLRDRRGQIAASVAWTARAAEELQRFTASAARREFLADGEVFLPEMPFAHPRRTGEWMEGIMDLVILTRGGAKLWIVDWKTDRRRPSDTDDRSFLRRLAEKYAPQLRAYAEVFAHGLGRPVDRLLLYSTALGETVRVD
ncbi:MAG: PD-(D/E)XK nuclease family protein [Gluconacetobacter diazotrophicus]|nr:PD-(D/E)XK nuclease family protein [Gluconacetobacter diazotrophicus]